MSGFKVYTKRCDECLFSAAKIVSEDRRSEILASCDHADTYFVCHKASMCGDEVMCRGDYDRAVERRRDPVVLRIARWLNVVEFVDLPNTRSLRDTP